ncbi:MAG: hypothetical protein Q8O61_14205 [Nocardioides sp.]|nr:hypothetical protein [Nocardioides sp.]
MSDEQPERFVPTSGRVPGVLGVVLSATLVGFALVDRNSGFAAWGIALSALVGVLTWAAVLRPRVALVGEDLELRNMLETVHIPLAAIEELVLRQMLVVRSGDRRFVSPALGKPRRRLHGRAALGSSLGYGTVADTQPKGVDYADYIEQRIRQRMSEERTAKGVRPGSAEQQALASGVRRQPAWPEIVALVGLALVAVVTFVV